MSETFDTVIREYIDFVNQQIGVYMDALAGFEGHRIRVGRQVHRVNRATKIPKDRGGETAVVWICYEDPTKPDVILNHIIRADDYIAANSIGGVNEQQQARSFLIFIFTYWEDEIRPRLSSAKGIKLNEIQSDIMGDLRILRHAILHAKSIVRKDEYNRLKKLQYMFQADKVMHISYEDMHQICILIKQDLARMLFDYLGVKDAPVRPEEIDGLAIQQNRGKIS